MNMRLAGIMLAFLLAGGPALARQSLAPTFLSLEGSTLVASAVVTEAPYGADRSGRQDSTAAVQRALDAVEAQGGGVVFLPAGRYRLEGSLRIGYAVTLKGETATEPGAGTLLVAAARPGSQPLIDVTATEGGIDGIAIWYPAQAPEDVIAYPFTIRGRACRLRNITLYNAYNGIEFEMVNTSIVENIRGTVLHRGILAPESSEFSWMRDVHFSNTFWREAAPRIGRGALSADQSAALDRFTKRHLIGLELGRLDGLAILRYRAEDAAIPVRIRKNEHVNQHQVFGFGGVVAQFEGHREEFGWDPWYFGMHFANVDNVPEAKGLSYSPAAIPAVQRRDAGSFIDVTLPPYLATGDGRSDDTNAIQSALEAAGKRGGGTVFLRPGEYRVSRPLLAPQGVELRGPLGFGKARAMRETCALAIYSGRDVTDAETAPAAITLLDHAGVRGFEIVYPEQSYDPAELHRYPYSIRGQGSGVWIADMLLINSYHGIDLAQNRCDEHVVANVWATAFHNGIAIGGGSRNGHLERMAFSYGPWSEAGRLGKKRTLEGKRAIAGYWQRHSVQYTFGDCTGERAWGLVGFYPFIHFQFGNKEGRGPVDAELWQSMLDVAYHANVRADAGRDIRLVGFFGTGGKGDTERNWLEVGDRFEGPLHVYARNIQQTFHKHPMSFRPDQVHLHDEVSLATGQPVLAGYTGRDSHPAHAVDRDARTLWEAPAGSWLQVDLGRITTVNRFGIQSAGLFSDGRLNTEEAELHVSEDGRTFSLAGRLRTNGFAWADRPIAPVQARYVRLYVPRPGADGRIRVATFGVWGPGPK